MKLIPILLTSANTALITADLNLVYGILDLPKPT